jgi:hypothetical protein
VFPVVHRIIDDHLILRSPPELDAYVGESKMVEIMLSFPILQRIARAPVWISGL